MPVYPGAHPRILLTNQIHQHKDRRSYHHRTDRHRCGTGRTRCAGEVLLEEGCHPEEGRQGQQEGGQAAPTKEAGTPRAESKGAKILELIGRPKGASLAEIQKATDWRRTACGGSSTAAKKHGITIESTKTESGGRVYQIKK
jgi:Protein of unknown function (DUF3489)